MLCKRVFLPFSNVCDGWVEEEEEAKREGGLAFLLLLSRPCACFSIAITMAWEMASRNGERLRVGNPMALIFLKRSTTK